MRHNCQSSIMDEGLHLRLLRLQLRDQTRPLRPLCGILGPWMSMVCSTVQTYAQYLLCVMFYHMFQIVSVPGICPQDHFLFSDGFCCVSTGFDFLLLLSFWSCGSSCMFVRYQVWNLLGMLNPSMSCFLLTLVSYQIGSNFPGHFDVARHGLQVWS